MRHGTHIHMHMHMHMFCDVACACRRSPCREERRVLHSVSRVLSLVIFRVSVGTSSWRVAVLEIKD